MRKKVFGKKLGRNTNTRKALFRGLIRSMVLDHKIKTTKAKAKAVQPDLDKLLTLVKKNTVNSRRMVFSKSGNSRLVTSKLFKDFSRVSKARNSGFTRITALPQRRGDNAEMVQLEWIDHALIGEPKPKKTKTKNKK